MDYRISAKDVRTIFNSINTNTPPPPHLSYHIIPSYGKGNGKSPAPVDYKPGLYVLLEPRPKKPYHVPSKLKSLVLDIEPKPTLYSWSLSGPQSKDSSRDLNQRYCQPTKRDTPYGQDMRGVMWTKFEQIENGDAKKTEDLKLRVLQVYVTAKITKNRRKKGLSTRKPLLEFTNTVEPKTKPSKTLMSCLKRPISSTPRASLPPKKRGFKESYHPTFDIPFGSVNGKFKPFSPLLTPHPSDMALDTTHFPDTSPFVFASPGRTPSIDLFKMPSYSSRLDVAPLRPQNNEDANLPTLEQQRENPFQIQADEPEEMANYVDGSSRLFAQQLDQIGKTLSSYIDIASTNGAEKQRLIDMFKQWAKDLPTSLEKVVDV